MMGGKEVIIMLVKFPSALLLYIEWFLFKRNFPIPSLLKKTSFRLRWNNSWEGDTMANRNERIKESLALVVFSRESIRLFQERYHPTLPRRFLPLISTMGVRSKACLFKGNLATPFSNTKPFLLETTKTTQGRGSTIFFDHTLFPGVFARRHSGTSECERLEKIPELSQSTLFPGVYLARRQQGTLVVGNEWCLFKRNWSPPSQKQNICLLEKTTKHTGGGTCLFFLRSSCSMASRHTGERHGNDGRRFLNSCKEPRIHRMRVGWRRHLVTCNTAIAPISYKKKTFCWLRKTKMGRFYESFGWFQSWQT